MSAGQAKQPVAGAVDLNVGTWYRAAGTTGMWYANPMAAGSFDAIQIDGRRLIVEGGGCVSLVDARDARKTAFDSSAWVAELEAARTHLMVAESMMAEADDYRYEGQLGEAYGALMDILDTERRRSATALNSATAEGETK